MSSVEIRKLSGILLKITAAVAVALVSLCLYVTPASAVLIDLWLPVDSGTTQHLYDVEMVDANTGWVVGSQGTLLKTVDGGATWALQNIGYDDLYDALYDVEFVSADEGWISGFGGTILHTTNGGVTWEKQTSPNDKSSWWRMDFIDSEHGWLSGLFGDYAYTTDGGDTWLGDTAESDPTFDRVMFFMQFFDEDNGFAAGKAGLFASTSDGGLTWNMRAGGTLEDLSSVDYFADGSPCTVGAGGTILTYSSKSGMLGWMDRSTTVKADLNTVYALDAENGWIAGDSGVILVSEDGGRGWEEQDSGTSADLYDIYFHDTSSGWAVGDFGIIHATSNGGETWSAQTSGTSENLRSVYFDDADNGWAVGDNGTILATTNGGTTWGPQTSGATENLKSVQFADASSGWAMGDNGTILATTNGGTTWGPQTSGTSSAVFGADVIDSTTACVAGGDGVILKTTNGTTWAAQSSGVDKDLRSVAYHDADNAVAVGANGVILKTEDGGATWFINGSPISSEWVFSGYFLDANNGWVAGTDGMVLKTDDGGDTWTDISIPQAVTEGERLYDPHFLDVNNGWVAGKNGHIFKTTDGGATWTLDFDGTIFEITDRTYKLNFVDEHNAIGVGRYGVILKYGTVDVPVPDAEFSASRVAASTGRKVTFNDESTGEVYYAPFSYEWDLGDGTITDEEKPVHRYTSSGKYTVTITVTNIAGQDELTKTDYIFVAPPGKEGVDTGTEMRITSLDGNFNLRLRELSLSKRVAILIDKGEVPAPPQGYIATPSTYIVDIVDEDGEEVTTLTQSASITKEYTSGDVAAAGGDATKLVLAYYDDVTDEWVVMDDSIVDKTARTVSVDTTHLSKWAVLVRADEDNTSGSSGGCAAATAAASGLEIASGFGLIGMLGTAGVVFAGRNRKRNRKR